MQQLSATSAVQSFIVRSCKFTQLFMENYRFLMSVIQALEKISALIQVYLIANESNEKTSLSYCIYETLH